MSFSLDAAINPYEYYTQRIRYIWNQGIVSLPVAGPVGSLGNPNPPLPPADGFANRQPAAIGQVHAPIGFKIVLWNAQRVGVFPFVPNPYTQDPNNNDNLIASEIDVDTPTLLADENTFVTRASGVYIYAMNQPVWCQDPTGLPYGHNPYENSLSTFSFPAAAFIVSTTT